MKRWLIILAFVIAVAIGFFAYDAASSVHPMKQITLTAPSGQRLTLDVADTTSTREQGLSDRPSMATSSGMLFVFDTPGDYPFWMNRMRFPLDIIWLEQGTVVDEVTLPPPANGAPPAIHDPGVQADRVIELNAGQASANGIGLGTHLTLDR